LTAFVEESAASIENLIAAGQANSKDALIKIQAEADIDPVSNKERLVISFRHRVSPAVQRFLKEHLHIIGREIIATPMPDRLRMHRGLYYMGVLLKNSGGEFLRPTIENGYVSWSLAFTIVAGNLNSIYRTIGVAYESDAYR
jgi:hypothetical protein